MVDGKPVEGTWRAHQVPVANFGGNPDHLQILENWMRAIDRKNSSMRKESSRRELNELAPKGDRRMGANPHANGGLLLRDLVMPDFRNYAVEVSKPATAEAEATRVLGTFLRDVMKANLSAKNFRVFGPDETASNRLEAIYEVSPKEFMEELLDTDENLSPRWPRDGSSQRTSLPGLARRLSPDRTPRIFLLLRGFRPHRGLDVQSAREMAEGDARHSLAPPDRLAQLSRSPRTSGARTITASRIRTPALSTTS